VLEEHRMTRVLIGELGAIVELGLRELLRRESDCEIVAEPTAADQMLAELESAHPDVVLLDLDDSHASTDLAMAISSSHPGVKIIACSSSEPRMRVFPPFHNGESYVARMSPELLIEAVKQN
jgi:DNA-binding NarL/FixJ family response regulator